MAPTKTIFCAACQADIDHDFRVSTNHQKIQELISRCGCGRELKWPVDVDAPTLTALFAAHKEQNQGHVFVAEDGSTELHPVLDVLAGLN